MFQAKVVEKIRSRILCSITFFFFLNRAMCKIRENMVDLGRPQMTIYGTLACWITKTTDTLEILNTTFPQQQWLRDCTSMVHYTYIACLFQLYCFLTTVHQQSMYAECMKFWIVGDDDCKISLFHFAVLGTILTHALLLILYISVPCLTLWLILWCWK